MARVEYIRLEKELIGFRGIASTWKYAQVPQEEQSRLSAQIDSLNVQFEAKKKELNDVTNRLVDSDFWPVASKGVAGGIRGTVEELRGQVKDMSETIQKMENLRLSVSTGSTTPPKEKEGTLNVESNRPVKRRRTDDQDVDMTAPIVQPQNVASSQEFESLKDQLLGLEEQIVEMRNELVQYDNHLLLQLQDEMEAKFEEFGIKPEGSVSIPPSASASSLVSPMAQTPSSTVVAVSPPLEAPGISQSDARMVAVERQVVSVGDDVLKLANEVAEVIKLNNARDQDMLYLQQENEHLKAQVNYVSEYANCPRFRTF